MVACDCIDILLRNNIIVGATIVFVPVCRCGFKFDFLIALSETSPMQIPGPHDLWLRCVLFHMHRRALVTEKLFGKYVKQKPEFCKIQLYQHCISKYWLSGMSSGVSLSSFKKQMLKCRCVDALNLQLESFLSWYFCVMLECHCYTTVIQKVSILASRTAISIYWYCAQQP